MRRLRMHPSRRESRRDQFLARFLDDADSDDDDDYWLSTLYHQPKRRREGMRQLRNPDCSRQRRSSWFDDYDDYSGYDEDSDEDDDNFGDLISQQWQRY